MTPPIKVALKVANTLDFGEKPGIQMHGEPTADAFHPHSFLKGLANATTP
jgi:hypothetical protein